MLKPIQGVKLKLSWAMFSNRPVGNVSHILFRPRYFWGGDGPNDKGLCYKHIVEGANNALKRLQLEYVDFIFAHRPDPETPIEETVRAMDLIIRQGKAFYWGTSEWSAADIMKADSIARQYQLTPPSMEQPQYNMLVREKVEKEFAPLYKELGYGTTIWSPLASGILTGKYNDGIPDDSRMALKGYGWLRKELTEEKIITVRQLKSVSDDLGISLPQMAIAWCLKESQCVHGNNGSESSGTGTPKYESFGCSFHVDQGCNGQD